MSNSVSVSITELVQLSCATGDLVNTGPPGPTALQGQRAHKKLQKERSEDQQAEVKLESIFEFEGWSIKLGGRVDLLDEVQRPPQIIEIKSCLAAPDKLPESQRAQHWAQLYFYGYCKLNNQKLDSIKLSLHWINLNDNSLVTEDRKLSRHELQEFCEPALRRFLQFHVLIKNHRLGAINSAKSLTFPFADFRPGQRHMATAVFRCIRDKGRLISEAPTGIGKTISTLFPAIKAMGETHTERIFYLTAKNSGRQAADQAVKSLRHNGLAISSVQLSAKQQLCHCSNGSCDRTDDGFCPLTLGFFDRLPAAREELIKLQHIDTDALDAAAHKHQVCPFELALQLVPWMDLVICDYNYVFDPLVRLTQVVESASKICLLIDEAHNLVDRARNMYSADLSKQDCRAAIKISNTQPVLAKRFASLDRAITRYTSEATEPSVEELSPLAISRAVAKCITEFGEPLNGSTLPPELGEWFKTLYRYAVIDELYGEHHRTIASQKNKDRQIKLACLNATDKLLTSFSSFQSVVCFSATLSPSHVYQSNLGLPVGTLHQQLNSPFDSDQLGCYICSDIDTRYAARKASTPTLIKIIEQLYRVKPGNYLVFFPSYAYLNDVYDLFKQQHPDIPVAAQTRTTDPEERAVFRKIFEQAGDVLGFAILGGVYSEGVDYIGESLLGAVVVGTGFPAVDTELQLVKTDYEQQGLDGFDYAFKYPGMTRVLQAAGRVIRSETDRGVVILADRRFNQAFYRQLMPSLWCLESLKKHSELTPALEKFWRSN